MTLRLKPALLPLALFLSLGAFYVAYSALNTLGQLDAIERERDRWQQPAETLAALELHEGNLVVDLGSGAGYFTLKLSSAVGASGRVVAVDLRRLSLAFLWARARIRGLHNVHSVVADPDNPHLPEGADALLLCNTYHELGNPEQTLGYAYGSLVSGGRLVVADREPETGVAAEHAVSASLARTSIEKAGFLVVREERFLLIDPEEHQWWLLVARKQ